VARLDTVDAVVRNAIFFGDVADSELRMDGAVGFSTVSSSTTPWLDLSGGVVPWTGMVDDPLFYPYSSFPQPTSPVIDAGDPALLDRDGTRSDQGAYGGPYGLIPSS
jgi:hypothetical protein